MKLQLTRHQSIVIMDLLENPSGDLETLAERCADSRAIAHQLTIGKRQAAALAERCAAHLRDCVRACALDEATAEILEQLTPAMEPFTAYDVNATAEVGHLYRMHVGVDMIVRVNAIYSSLMDSRAASAGMCVDYTILGSADGWKHGRFYLSEGTTRATHLAPISA